MNPRCRHIIEDLCERDDRYKKDAYHFVMEALTYTQKKFKRFRHVTGEEMLEGMKELLMNTYGPMTMTVLEFWGIHDTEDFGNIVFNLIENNVLSKTEEDDMDSFRDGYDFEEVFDRGYLKKLNKRISRMR